jgi:NADPH2:quinone reductase
MKAIRFHAYRTDAWDSGGLDPASRGLFLTRPSLAHYIADAASFNHRASSVLNWVAQKSLKLRIGKVYPLEEVAQAKRDLEARKTTGKLVVKIS